QQDVWIEYQNTGAQPWYDNTSKPAGGYAVHYANTNPINRASQFYDSTTWLNNNRPSRQFAAVYESDGTTLAANQHVAQPGQIVKFSYNYAAPANAAPGTYTEDIQLVREGATDWNFGGWGFFKVTVSP
ncbi:MAG TPA: hypothetical protein VFH39_05265, partial [Candidatus Saccharimonadales bacterium]|nr:hypothetical protein [Candidatus Saccharimonadales bacterium]